MTSLKIVTLNESTRIALDAAEKAVGVRARKAVRPIYINDGNDPEHFATCTFIEVDDQDYLVTCAHVVDAANASATLFVAEGELHGITATFQMTTPPSARRDADLYDFAFTAVGPEWRDRGIVPLAESEMLSSNVEFYEAYGFPNSRNSKKTINHQAKKIRPTVNPFISMSVEDPVTLDAAGITSEHHLALFRDPDCAFLDGRKIRPFEPVGMSGGAIFAMHDLTDLEVLAGVKIPRVTLAALITHKSKAQKLLFGTRLTTIVSAIRANGKAKTI